MYLIDVARCASCVFDTLKSERTQYILNNIENYPALLHLIIFIHNTIWSIQLFSSKYYIREAWNVKITLWNSQFHSLDLSFFFLCKGFWCYSWEGAWTSYLWHLQHQCWGSRCHHSSSRCWNSDRGGWSSAWLGRHRLCMCTLNGCGLCTEPQLSCGTESLLWSTSEALPSTGCLQTLNQGTDAQEQTLWMSQPLIWILNVLWNRQNDTFGRNCTKWIPVWKYQSRKNYTSEK